VRAPSLISYLGDEIASRSVDMEGAPLSTSLVYLSSLGKVQ
jgi:hypothetical protein